MDSIQDFAPEIQQRISNFVRFLPEQGFSRPEVKNIGCLFSAMLKRHDVRLSQLSRSLEEPISPKKVWERLSRNLRRKELGERLLAVNIKKNRAAIRRMRFCIIDLTDIQKRYAEKMEGLSRVRDGDKSSRKRAVIGNGYWQVNAVMADRTQILPVHSEIYSLDYEGKDRVSENTKILDAVVRVHEAHPDVVIVVDRGGDRSVILENLLEADIGFVIRGQEQRSLKLHRDSEKTTNILTIAKRTKLKAEFKSQRGRMFGVGIRRVYLNGHSFWLVVLKGRRGGLSWYLAHMKGTREEVMSGVLEGYGLRWGVEEYHRQIKGDFQLEEIRLRAYDAIKNMGVLVMLAASFYARLPVDLVIRMMAAARLLPRMKIRDVPGYVYYRVVEAVARVLESSRKNRPKPLRIRKRDYWQLILPLELSEAF